MCAFGVVEEGYPQIFGLDIFIIIFQNGPFVLMHSTEGFVQLAEEMEGGWIILIREHKCRTVSADVRHTIMVFGFGTCLQNWTKTRVFGVCMQGHAHGRVVWWWKGICKCMFNKKR